MARICDNDDDSTRLAFLPCDTARCSPTLRSALSSARADWLRQMPFWHSGREGQETQNPIYIKTLIHQHQYHQKSPKVRASPTSHGNSIKDFHVPLVPFH